jgi:hypothetical protein
VNEHVIEALAVALGVPLPPERLAAVAAQLEEQIAGQGGFSAEELDGFEPAIVFEPAWDR